MLRKREIHIAGDLAYVELTQGFVATISAQDADRVGRHNWHVMRHGERSYAATGRRGERVLLHRFIMDAGPQVVVDHIDRDGLNNVRGNLRLASPSENGINAKRSVRNTSGFKGVYWHRVKCRWVAAIAIQKKRTWIGTFECPIQAHAAYLEKARAIYGEFARPE